MKSTIPLLFEAPGYDDPPVFTARTESISVLQLLRTSEMRTPLLIMAYAMIGQQFSGTSLFTLLITKKSVISVSFAQASTQVSL